MEGGGRRQFQVVGCLGRGGFGEVYRATMSSAGGLEAEVALKVLRRDLDPRGQAVRRLRDEGRLLARLNHPTILRVHDLVVLDGRVSLITEFVDGEDLATLFKGDPRPSPRALLEVIAQVAGALDVAWNAPLEGGEPLRLVHRDIKPSNIRVSRHGEVKLLDFGIARADSVEREARTQTDLMVGSPAYMAPERFLDTIVRPASDVFSLGSTLYEGLTGGRFYEDMPVPMLAAVAIDPDRFEAHLRKQLERLSSAPEPIVALLRDTLAYDPDARPGAGPLAARCEALADALTGAPLSRFCREHVWGRGPGESGELDGRNLTEGTIARERPPDPGPAPSAAPPRRRLSLYVAMGATLAGLTILLGMIGVAGGLTLGLNVLPDRSVATDLVPTPDAAPAPPQETTAPDEPDEAVGGEAPASEEPEPTDPPDEPTRTEPPPAPAPRVAPKAAPAVVQEPPPEEAVAPPPPAAAPDPEPVAPSTGRVSIGGDAAVRLASGGAQVTVPGEVPAGTYDVLATFNGNEVRVGSLEVRPGGDHHISCASRMFRCEIR